MHSAGERSYQLEAHACAERRCTEKGLSRIRKLTKIRPRRTPRQGKVMLESENAICALYSEPSKCTEAKRAVGRLLLSGPGRIGSQ